MNFVPQIKVIVEEAGKLLMEKFYSKLEVDIKPDGSIATDADIACEKLLKKKLAQIIPGSEFCAEESEKSDSGEYRWVIDPIDGTKNFACRIPYFCVAVALEHQGEVVAAVTYAPALQDWFYAEKGEGMWRNGKKVVWDNEHWKERTALMIERHDTISQNYIRKALKQKDIDCSFRYYGAAALDLAFIACGSIDALLTETLYWWDIAGGSLMVREAGGFVKIGQKNQNHAIQKLYAGKEEIYNLIFEKNDGF